MIFIKENWDLIVINNLLVAFSYAVISGFIFILTLMIMLGVSQGTAEAVGFLLSFSTFAILFYTGYKLPRILPKYNGVSFILLIVLLVLPLLNYFLYYSAVQRKLELQGEVNYILVVGPTIPLSISQTLVNLLPELGWKLLLTVLLVPVVMYLGLLCKLAQNNAPE